MDKKLTFKGIFYLKSGCIIEEEIIFDECNNQEDIDSTVKDLKDSIKNGLKDKDEFIVTFGFTIFRGSDISAVKFSLV